LYAASRRWRSQRINAGGAAGRLAVVQQPTCLPARRRTPPPRLIGYSALRVCVVRPYNHAHLGPDSRHPGCVESGKAVIAQWLSFRRFEEKRRCGSRTDDA